MNITEANKVALLLRFAAGEHAGTPEQIRDAFTYLLERASKPLQLHIHIDPNAVDAAITRHQQETRQ